MKKIYSIIMLALFTLGVKATTHTINISGFTYSPASLSVSVGDTITIQASATHPLAQVDQTTWQANGTTPMAGGFGVKTSAYTFTVSMSSQPIYYVCQNHASMGMKGQINVGVLTGINAFAAPAENLALFPNPASDSFSIRYNQEDDAVLSVNLYSVCGEKLSVPMSDTESGKGLHTIRITLPPSVSAGVYFVELTNGSRKTVKKLIVR